MTMSSGDTVRRSRVSAIVVTHNSRSDITSCLTSLKASAYPLHEIILIDNNSQDGTPDFVRREFPDVTILDYWDNPGFAEANNRAFRVASGDYCFLLNPDAVASGDALSRLVRELDEHPSAGVAVAKALLAREPSIINSAGLWVNQLGYACDRGYLEWDRGQYDDGGPILAGSGCALLLRLSMLRRLGGFDSTYFLYYEDLDLCFRAWLAGFSVRYVPDAVVHHSMKVSERPLLYNEYLDHRNRLRTTLKVWSLSGLARILPRAIGFDLRAVVGLVVARRRRAAALRMRAWGWNLLHLASTLGQRRRAQRLRTIPDRLLEQFLVPGYGAPRIHAAVPDYAELYDDSAHSAQLDGQLSMGRNDVGLLGLGWYGRETADGMTYRWSCGYGIVFLRPPLATRRATMVITCQSPISNIVGVRINRRACPPFTVSAGGWTECAVTVELDREVARIDLLPEKVVVPAQALPTSPDRRVLGLAVARIGFR
jgi:GT2 family glycosyltransferase